jgi:hypothetical protein
MDQTMRKTALAAAVLMVGAALTAPALAASCQNNNSYERWLEDFKKDAATQGISPRVIAAASPSMTFDHPPRSWPIGLQPDFSAILRPDGRRSAHSERPCQDQATRGAVRAG